MSAQIHLIQQRPGGKRQRLREAVESVLTQTYPNVEVQIVDDGSTDETPQIIQQWAGNPRVRLCRQVNAGQASAKNRAVELSRGRFVAFLDADDTWLPGRLTKTIEALETHPTTTMAFSDVVPIGANNLPLAPTYLHPGMARRHALGARDRGRARRHRGRDPAQRVGQLRTRLAAKVARRDRRRPRTGMGIA